MKRFIGILFLCLFAASSWGQVPAIRTAGEMAAAAAVNPRLSVSLSKTLRAMQRTSTFTPLFKSTIPGSLAQISLPNHINRTFASGFLLRLDGKVYVAMAYHVGGSKGTARHARVRTKDGQVYNVPVNIAINGTAGWHTPDISLAPLPEELQGLEWETLEIASPDLSRPVYSLGYSQHSTDLNDIVPLKRDLWSAEGYGLLGELDLTSNPFVSAEEGSGYCGAPLLQEFPDGWKAVGMHSGVDATTQTGVRVSAVNLSRAIPYLVSRSLHPDLAAKKGLFFRGQEVTRLTDEERVSAITVKRNGEVVYTQELRSFTQPYDDGRAELALTDFQTQKGDEVIFEITKHRTIESGRKLRYESLIIR